MSRSGYTDDVEAWALIRWRGAVKSSLRGKRGQAFLRELVAALDALPEKRLIEESLQEEGAVCAIGAVGRQRGVDMSDIDPEDHDTVARVFNVAHAMACEIMYENDQCGRGKSYTDSEGKHHWRDETPEERWQRMRDWATAHILKDAEHDRQDSLHMP